MGLLKTSMRLGGIVAILFGIVFTSSGAYGLAGGTGIRFTINERVVSAQEGGMIFSIVGIAVLFGGMAMIYFILGFPKLTILSIILGLCSLIIPAIFLGTGINLVAGIVLVFSYSFVATVFFWYAHMRKVSAFVVFGIFEFLIGSFLIVIIENYQLKIYTYQIGLQIFLTAIVMGMVYYAKRGHL